MYIGETKTSEFKIGLKSTADAESLAKAFSHLKTLCTKEKDALDQ